MSQYPLFDQGLRAALKRRPGVEVVDVCRDLDTAYDRARSLHPDVTLIIADPAIVQQDVFHRLEEISGSIIRISPGEGSMQVYRREQVDQASLDDLMAAIEMTANQWQARQQEAQERGTRDTGGAKHLPAPFRGPGNTRRANVKHYLIVIAAVAIISVIAAYGLQVAPLFPERSSVEAVTIHKLFSLELFIMAFLFALIVAFTGYAVIAFRRKPGDPDEGVHRRGHAGLEIFWTAIPFVIVMALAVLATQDLAGMETQQGAPLVVDVKSRQWSWDFYYPESGVDSYQLYLPRGRQVLFRITSDDVIHSFWVPELGPKQDAVPGMINTMLITPTVDGDYTVRCSEMCGTHHSTMIAPAKVVAPADFEAWLVSQTSGTAPTPAPTPGAQPGA
jgi:cytochrome c oxidase subunit II